MRREEDGRSLLLVRARRKTNTAGSAMPARSSSLKERPQHGEKTGDPLLLRDGAALRIGGPDRDEKNARAPEAKRRQVGRVERSDSIGYCAAMLMEPWTTSSAEARRMPIRRRGRMWGPLGRNRVVWKVGPMASAVKRTGLRRKRGTSVKGGKPCLVRDRKENESVFGGSEGRGDWQLCNKISISNFAM